MPVKLTDMARIVFAPPVVAPRSIGQWLRAPISRLPFAARQAVWHPALVDRIFTALHQSPSFAAMMDEVPDLADVPVYFLPLKGEHADSDGLYSPGDNAVLINYKPRRGDYFRPQHYRWLNVMAHEYRHAFQHKLPHGRFNKNLTTMSRRVMEGFLAESDACAFAATVAWELRQAGVSPNYWRSFAITYPGIAEAFVTAIREDGASLHDGRAQTAAVLAWFGNERRVNHYAADYIRHVREYMMQPPQERAARDNGPERKEDDKVTTSRLPALFDPDVIVRPQEQAPKDDAAPRTEPPRFFAYCDAQGVVHERTRYLEENALPTGMDFYCRKLTAARWREIETLDRELQIYLAKYNAARRSRGPQI